MRELISSLFDSEMGKKVYSAAELAIENYGMSDLISSGVVVGFSGGADSVMLLSVLLEYSRRHNSFPLLAIHINHMIRGEEAVRDEEFSRDFCKKLSVEFRAIRIDVPAIAEARRCGLEEAARDARYSAFRDVMRESGRYSAIAVAHNSTDNLETMIFNMMRGAGINGMSGILPVRDNIVRPLIYSSKNEIREALSAFSIPYVVDSTNLSSEYTRNFIRNEIIPKLCEINATPEKMAMRVAENLGDDSDFIDSAAERFISENFLDNRIRTSALSNVHKSLLFRILAYMMRQFFCGMPDAAFSLPEKTHVDLIYSKLAEKDFSYCLPGGVSFVSDGGWCYLKRTTEEPSPITRIPELNLSNGLNSIDGFSSVVVISQTADLSNYLNVYKIAIQKQIPFDIINGNIRIRSKLDGDSYAYGGMTHKLKKLFCDRKIPCDNRMLVPVFFDDSGVFWVPGFGVRSGSKKTKINAQNSFYISILEPLEENSGLAKLYF